MNGEIQKPLKLADLLFGNLKRHRNSVDHKTEPLANLHRDQPPPQALRFSHGRGERETRVTGDEPQGTMGRVSFPPSFARTS